ncbi:MAG: glutathione S-transferase [Burkholderiales bacterium]
MLTVHHLGLSQSERIVWLCEELAIPYELKVYARDPKTRLAPADYKALHPMGTAPVITDGTLVLAESGAIIEYILARYGKGQLTVAPDDAEFGAYLYWLHFANGTLMPSEMLGMLKTEEPFVQVMRLRSDRGLAMMNQRLGQVPYLGGQALTAADIMTVFVLTTMRAFNRRSLTPYPHILTYLARIGERPAYQRAMAKGDPTLKPMLA